MGGTVTIQTENSDKENKWTQSIAVGAKRLLRRGIKPLAIGQEAER